MFDGCIFESRRQAVRRSPAKFTSDCDLQGNFRTSNARCLDYAFAGTPAPIQTHKPILLEKLEVSLDILEISANELRQLIDRAWTLVPDHSQQRETGRGQKIPRSLDAGEIHTFPSGNSLSSGDGLESRPEAFKRFMERLHSDRERLGHRPAPLMRRMSAWKSTRSLSTPRRSRHLTPIYGL